MKPRDLWHRKKGWERVPDVVGNIPHVLNSGLAAVDAARTALDSTMNAVDAVKAGSRANRSVKVEKAGGLSPLRGGLLVVGGAVAIGLGSAAVSSMRQRESSIDDVPSSMPQGETWSDDDATPSRGKRESLPGDAS